jgi:hypothetical protein
LVLFGRVIGYPNKWADYITSGLAAGQQRRSDTQAYVTLPGATVTPGVTGMPANFGAGGGVMHLVTTNNNRVQVALPRSFRVKKGDFIDCRDVLHFFKDLKTYFVAVTDSERAAERAPVNEIIQHSAANSGGVPNPAAGLETIQAIQLQCKEFLVPADPTVPLGNPDMTDKPLLSALASYVLDNTSVAQRLPKVLLRTVRPRRVVEHHHHRRTAHS